jgi:hypothetical protein
MSKEQDLKQIKCFLVGLFIGQSLPNLFGEKDRSSIKNSSQVHKVSKKKHKNPISPKLAKELNQNPPINPLTKAIKLKAAKRRALYSRSLK